MTRTHRRRGRGWLGLATFAGLLIGLGWLADQIPLPRAPLPPRDGPAFVVASPGAAASVPAARTTPPSLRWGYQLQGVRPDAIPPAIDVLVIDYSRDGSQREAWQASEVEALRRRPDGSRRIVLAYMSVGEAESYRYYWWGHWTALGDVMRPLLAPAWLGEENKDWAGNFPVRYWRPDWQRIIVAPGESLLQRLLATYLPWRKPYLDRMLEAGFDGIYLDRVDVYSEWHDERPSAERDMADFVNVIAATARQRKPGFLIVPQNGEELLAFDDYRKTIDGIAKEDLLFGIDGDGQRNPASEIRKSIGHLARLADEGKPVLVVEYLSDPAQRAKAMEELTALGFPPLFAARALDRPPEPAW